MSGITKQQKPAEPAVADEREEWSTPKVIVSEVRAAEAVGSNAPEPVISLFS